jgi:hypothetical protein
MESIVETKASSILQFIHGLRGELHVTWEEGTWTAWLYDLLKPHVQQVLVCDPRRNALLKEGNKSDKIDARKLADLAASPLRSEKRKSDVAPLFVPRDSAGYLIITCPKCLRPNKLEAMSLNGGLHQTICQTCGMPVRFKINHEIEPLTERKYA